MRSVVLFGPQDIRVLERPVPQPGPGEVLVQVAMCGTCYERHDRAAGIRHRFRFGNDVPLNASNADVRVNVIEYWEMGEHKIQHFSWVTDLRVSKLNVFHHVLPDAKRKEPP